MIVFFRGAFTLAPDSAEELRQHCQAAVTEFFATGFGASEGLAFLPKART